MPTPVASPTSLERTSHDARAAAGYREGIIAGLIGAGTIAAWFFLLDVIRGRPFFTPAALGTFVFKGPQALAAPETIDVGVETVVGFTWIHALVFCALGGLAVWLLTLAEENPQFGFGIVLLMVFFEFGFIVGAMFLAEPLLKALTWPAILLGNLFAIAAMGGYLRWRHPGLRILP